MKTAYICLGFLVIGLLLGIATGTMIKADVPEEATCTAEYSTSGCVYYDEDDGLVGKRFVDIMNTGTEPITLLMVYENDRQVEIDTTIMPEQKYTHDTDSCDVDITDVDFSCGLYMRVTRKWLYFLDTRHE